MTKAHFPALSNITQDKLADSNASEFKSWFFKKSRNKDPNLLALEILGWNTSNCYFSQEKCPAQILLAASVAFQRMQSKHIEHICKCGTAFNVSNELCTGCGSKSELGVIICSVSKKTRFKPRALFSVPKGKLQHYHCCIPFLLPFHCSSLSGWFLFLSCISDFRFCNFKLEENSGIPKPNPLLSCYQQNENWMFS